MPPPKPSRPAKAAKRRETAPAKPSAVLRALPPTSQLHTLRDWLAFAEGVYAEAGLALGQVATTAHDEALYLFLHTLKWPLDSDPSVLERKLSPDQRIGLRRTFERRAVERTPAAYITGEAWLGEYRFHVDERVIIPRSYFLEIIPEQLGKWFPDDAKPLRIVDVCTGSGCLAILLAHRFPKATVDAIDLSPAALEVATINVKAHRVGKRVRLFRSDVFDSVPAPDGGYDLIVSNPPYEPSAICDALPAEFQREPRMALDGGSDGLDVIRKLLRQAEERLAPGGMILIEVGGLRRAMERAFPERRLVWLKSQDGADCVCAIGPRRRR